MHEHSGATALVVCNELNQFAAQFPEAPTEQLKEWWSSRPPLASRCIVGFAAGSLLVVDERCVVSYDAGCRSWIVTRPDG